MIKGPKSFVSYMFARDRTLYSAAYFGTLFLTLYCSMGLKATVPTIAAASAQFAVLFYYFIGYIPGGTTGIKWLFKLWWVTMKNIVLPCFTRCLKVCLG